MTAKASAETASTGATGGVLATLQAYKDSLPKQETTTLPKTGVSVTYPGFIGHSDVMDAVGMAGKKTRRAGIILVSKICRFEGEALTVQQIDDLVPHDDVTHLISKTMGATDDEDEAGSGN